MNTGETEIINDPLTGALAPITRIGGGEVRVDQAVATTAAAWDSDGASAALSFGFVDVTDTVTMTKTVRSATTTTAGAPSA
jgi:minor extracellular serine protease Vpr